MYTDAFEVRLEACAVLIGEIIVDKKGREAGAVEGCFRESTNREGKIPAEGFGARSDVDSVAVLLPVVCLCYLSVSNV